MLPAPYVRFRDEIVSLDPDRYPPKWIDAQVRAGLYRVWGTDSAVILAEIKTYPSGIKEVHGVAAAGDLNAIFKLIPLAERWGRENGCRDASIESHPAWSRLLPGYVVSQVRIVKTLA